MDIVITGLIFTCFTLILTNLYQQSRQIKIGEPQKLFFRNLNTEGRELLLVHLSDLHFRDNGYMKEKLLNCIDYIKPDLVLITGDLIDNSSGIPQCLSFLKKLKALCNVITVLGNHDYYSYKTWELFRKNLSPSRFNDIDSFVKELRAFGIIVLRNEIFRWNFKGNPAINIIGIDDPVTAHDQAEKAFQSINNELPSILLIHSAKNFIENKIYKRFNPDLILSGHTHAGQFRFPQFTDFIIRWLLKTHLLRGFFKIQPDVSLHIASGFGATWLLPMKFLGKYEINTIKIAPLSDHLKKVFSGEIVEKMHLSSSVQ